MTGQPERQLSSLELLLLGKLEPVVQTRISLRAGTICPRCGQGKLDYNGLLALECPVCGYASSEGGCT